MLTANLGSPLLHPPRPRIVHPPIRECVVPFLIQRRLQLGGKSQHVCRVASTETLFQASVVQPGSTVDTTLRPTIREADDAAVDAFVWTRNWWPLSPVSMLDQERPTAHTILNQDLAVWYRKEDQTWHVFRDLCPHRLAALSQGRIANGSLVCSYHGWSFGPEGRCNKIPQLPEEDQARVCSVKKTCVTSYPVLVQEGMLYVWLDASPQGLAESQTRGPPLVPGGVMPGKDNWVMYEVPNDMKSWLEQAMDPSHANFLHAGGYFRPENSIPMEAHCIPTVHTTQGFTYSHGGYELRNASMQATRDFVPPGTVVGRYRQAAGTLVLYTTFIPVRLGVCRTTAVFKFLPAGVDATLVRDSVKHRLDLDQQAHTTQPQQSKPSAEGPSAAPKTQQAKKEAPRLSLPALKLPNLGLHSLASWYGKVVQALVKAVLGAVFGQGTPHWLLVDWTLADQDVVALHYQERNLKGTGLSDAHYVMPAQGADVGVAAIDRWLRKAGYPDSLYGSNASYERPLPLAQLMDRQRRHVQHCKECQKALPVLTKVCQAVTAVAAVCGVYAISSAAAAVVCQGHLTPVAGWSCGVATVAAVLLGSAAQNLWEMREYRFISGLKAWEKAGGLSLVPRS